MRNTKLRIFGDLFYKSFSKDGKIIVYFGNLNRAIRLSYYNFYILRCILDSNGKTGDYIVDKYCLKRKTFELLTERLLNQKILFNKKKDLLSCYFKDKYKDILSSRRISKAYIHITQRCNLNCFYCYNKGNANKKDVLCTEEWMMVLQNLYVEGVRSFVFTGGEPFLRDDIVELVKSLPSDCDKTVLTNGTLLHGEKREVLKYVNCLIVSFDSLDCLINDANRKNSINYNILGNLRDVASDYKDKISVRTVVTRNNYKEIRELMDYVENELGFRFIVSECLPNSLSEAEQFVPFFCLDVPKQSISGINSCGAGSSVVAIDSNADVYPCQNLIRPMFRIGNVLQKNWKTNLSTNKWVKQLQCDVSFVKGCKKCMYKYLCGNGCKAICYNLYGKMNQKNFFMCKYLEEKSERKIEGLFGDSLHEYLGER